LDQYYDLIPFVAIVAGNLDPKDGTLSIPYFHTINQPVKKTKKKKKTAKATGKKTVSEGSSKRKRSDKVDEDDEDKAESRPGKKPRRGEKA